MGGQNPERHPPRVLDHLKLREWAADNPAWGLQVACGNCIHRAIILPKKLFRLRRPPLRIGELKARLICKECRSRRFSMRPELLMRRD